MRKLYNRVAVFAILIMGACICTPKEWLFLHGDQGPWGPNPFLG